MKVVDMSSCSIRTTHILGMCPSAKGCMKVFYERDYKLRVKVVHWLCTGFLHMGERLTDTWGLGPLPLSSRLHLMNGRSYVMLKSNLLLSGSVTL